MKHLLRAMGAAMLAALLLSACSTPQEQTEPSAPQTTQATQAATGATEESATEAEELLALPRDLGSGLTLQAVLPFSGPNVDADGAESDQLATIIVQNDGGMAVGAADITLTCEDGAELRFRVTDLPVGGSCYAFELNSAQYTGENRVCAASAEVEPDGSLSVDYRVSVMVQDGGLVLVNMTEDTLHNVTVRYRGGKTCYPYHLPCPRDYGLLRAERCNLQQWLGAARHGNCCRQVSGNPEGAHAGLQLRL